MSLLIRSIGNAETRLATTWKMVSARTSAWGVFAKMIRVVM